MFSNINADDFVRVGISLGAVWLGALCLLVLLRCARVAPPADRELASLLARLRSIEAEAATHAKRD